MARYLPFARRTLSLVLLAPAFLAAQGTPTPATPVAATTKTGSKVLTLADYGIWKRIGNATISSDGRTMAYVVTPNEGDATLNVRSLDGDKVVTATMGTAPAGGGGGGGGGFGGGGGNPPTFSDDGQWIGYIVNPPAPPRGPRPQGAPPARPPARRFELMTVATGERFSVPNVASFKFGKGSRWVAVKQGRSNPADTTRNGADLVLRELPTGISRNIGNVGLYEFDDAGRFFAYTVDAPEKLGNGLYVIDLGSGETKLLDGAAADFDQLTWADERPALAVLRGVKESGQKQKINALLAWTDLAGGKTDRVEFSPKDGTFPAGMVISEFTALRWAKDGSRVFLGIKEQETEAPKSDEPQANVDVWHWKDEDPQSVQMVRIQQLRRATYAGGVELSTRRFTRLADNDMRTVAYAPNGKWAVGRLDTPYRGAVAWGGSKSDLYRVNTATGERTLIAKGVTRTMGISPNSRWYLYLAAGAVKAYDLESGNTLDLNKSTGKSFVDAEDDHPYEKPTYGVAGWAKDGSSVLLNHRYDVYKVPLDGSAAVNLTGGIGDAQKIRFRLARFDQAPRGPGGGGIFGGSDESDDEGVDLTQPLTFSAYGDFTKKTGYWRAASVGATPTPLVWEDRAIGQVQKAKNADRIIFTQQTFNEFPDYWMSTTAMSSPKKVTDANPQLADYAWGRKVLVDYKNRKGQRLQGTLTLPANYEPGKKYPMLVYFYEIMSNTHHQFSSPTFDDRPHISTYASNGYLVLQPDVVYEIGKPGTSALDCVTAAVKQVIALGYADPKRIGLQGHSWGGYQSSFIVTQTDMFAAVVTGAPPTNLVSFYDELYKSTGTVQQGIMEVGQVRMGENVTPWNSHELYESQSPIHQATKIKTPFMILHGTADGAVDWHQGLEYFNAARRLGKEVILLSYPDEPHHLAKKENQLDFQVRMRQYFDHYLKGTPAPQWMVEGVPQVKKGAKPVA